MVFGMPRALFPALATDALTAVPASSATSTPRPYAGALVASLALRLDRPRPPAGARVVDRRGALGRRDRRLRLRARRSGSALLLLARRRARRTTSARSSADDPLAVDAGRAAGPRLRASSSRRSRARRALGNVEAGVVASLTSLRFSIVSGGVALRRRHLVIGLAVPALLSTTDDDATRCSGVTSSRAACTRSRRS